jgi:hypothetical protein
VFEEGQRNGLNQGVGIAKAVESRDGAAGMRLGWSVRDHYGYSTGSSWQGHSSPLLISGI